MRDTQLLFLLAAGALALAAAVLAYLLAAAPRLAVGDGGERGYARQRARENPLFALIEPVINMVAAWIRFAPLGELRSSLDDKLRASGDNLGLDPDEFVAASLLAAAGASLLVLAVVPMAWVALVVGALGLFTPLAIIDSRRADRNLSIARQLPWAIDILGLCISAGMDLPGSIRELLGDDPSRDDAIRSELRRVLRDLDLGHSRRSALQAFEQRTAAEGVREFVAAIVQSEEKGNPLGEVLMAQATVLRMRRSFRGEVLASQAGVKMAIPLAMIMLAILGLLALPMLLKMKENGL